MCDVANIFVGVHTCLFCQVLGVLFVTEAPPQLEKAPYLLVISPRYNFTLDLSEMLQDGIARYGCEDSPG